jgi:SpoVK/Ycf46/Vps4 family AAA+-type ATPase
MNELQHCFEQISQLLTEANDVMQGVLQDYFKMELAVNFEGDSWKRFFEEEVQKGHDGKFSNKYNDAWEKIQQVGIENYTVDDMDVTIIVALLKGRGSFDCCREREIRELLDPIKDYRNKYSHMSKSKGAEYRNTLTKNIVEACRNFTLAVLNLDGTTPPIASYDERKKYQETYRDRLNEIYERAVSTYKSFILAEASATSVNSFSTNAEAISVDSISDASDDTTCQRDPTIPDDPESFSPTEEKSKPTTPTSLNKQTYNPPSSDSHNLELSLELFENRIHNNALEPCLCAFAHTSLRGRWTFTWQVGTFTHTGKFHFFTRKDHKNIITCTATMPGKDVKLIKQFGPVKEEQLKVVALRLDYEHDINNIIKRIYLRAEMMKYSETALTPHYSWFVNDELVPNEDAETLTLSIEQHKGKTIRCQVSFDGYDQKFDDTYTVEEEIFFEKKLTLSVGEHEEKRVIWAKIGEKVLPKEKYSCSWSVRNANGKVDPIFYKGVHLGLSDLHVTDEVFCTATRNDNQAQFTASIMLNEEHFAAPAPTPAPAPAPAPAPVPHPTPTPEPTTDPIPEPKTEPQPSLNPVPDPEPEPRPTPVPDSEPKSPAISGQFTFEKPTEVVAPKFRCFDSNDSRLHYFVAQRNTWFCTNTYEYMDYYSFLYNLLRDHGYERVIIVSNFSENEGDNYPVIAYDAFSQYSFLKFEEYKKMFKGERSIKEEAKKAFCNKYSDTAKEKATDSIRAASGGRVRTAANHAEDCPQYGRRVIKTLVKSNSASTASSDNEGRTGKEILESFIISEVNAAMKSTILKTAIVLPLEMILEREWISPLVVRLLSEMTSRKSKNAIIVTADQKEDFFSLFDGDMSNRFKGFDKDFAKAIASIQGAREPQAYCNAFVSALEKNSRILIALERPQTDEIANYFFMMKLKQPKRFERLPFSKIYSLAEFILDHCGSKEQTQKTFPNLENNTWYIDSLESLDLELDNDDTLTALIDITLGTPVGKPALWDKNINITRGLKATSVERINGTSKMLTDEKTKKRYSGTPLERYTITEAERLSITESAQSDLNEMIGLRNVKTTIRELTREAVNNAKRNRLAPEPGNYIFEGNPGTGKTEVARLMGKMLHAAGLLRKGHTIEVSASDLVSQFVSETAIKTRKKCEEALDGVLFIDEAYELVNTNRQHEASDTNSHKQEAYDELLKFMEDNRSRFCLIAAGYPNKMNAFRTANEGMLSRIPDSNVIRFDDYSTDELIQILKLMAKKKGYVNLSDDFVEEAKLTLEEMKAEKGDRFGNGRDVRSILAMSLRKAESRSSSDTVTLIREDIEANRNIRDPEAAERAWAALDRYVGLKNIKAQLKEVVDYQRAFGIIEVDSMIFAGPPGTGKSEVAKLIAPILKAEGILKTDTFVPAPLENLIGRAHGETESKTKALCTAAENGVLFVDEAYGLINKADRSFKGPYEEAAYTTIMRFMTEHKNHIVVIFAGYADMMDAFVKANPGMARRIKVIKFEPYSDDELVEIFRRKAEVVGKRGKRIHLEFSEEFSRALKKCFPVMRKIKGDTFGNAGEIEGLLTRCSFSAAKRLGTDLERESTLILTTADIPEEYRAVEDPRETIPIDTEAPLFSLVPKSAISDLPDPYQGIDIHGSDFPGFCRGAVLRIQNEYGTATAFVISPNGLAITCAHAVAFKKDLGKIASQDLYAFFKTIGEKEKQYPYEIVNIRPDLDMAMIKIIAGHPLPYLTLAAENRSIKFGEDCLLYGYPDGRKGIMQFPGTISTEAEMGGDGELGSIHFFSGEAYPGDSGGPIIAKSDGCVIGILRGARGPQDGIKHNYLKPIYYFWKEFLN